MKCFLDANVLFSAANEPSRMHHFIEELQQRHECLTSNYAQEEAIRNIRAKRSQWEYGFTLVMQQVAIVQSIDRSIRVEIALKDRPILATAIDHKCDRLITGDKRNFGHLFQKTIQGVTILTPLQFADELNSNPRAWKVS